MTRFSPRGLIFDMDGLLVDSEPLWQASERAFAAARGGEWTDAMYRACVGQGIGRIVHVMGELLGFAVDEARDVRELEDLFIARISTLETKPGALAFLAATHGRLPVGLASSSPRRLIDATLERFGIANHFDVTVSGQEVARAKPFPDVYLRAAELLNVPAQDCLALEDSRTGARAAREAGMTVIAVPEGETSGFDGIADVVVTSLHEARALVAF